jgi:hypothetical protein
MKSEILSGLWVASKDEFDDSMFMIHKKIDFIINCTTINIENYISILNEKYNKNILYLNIPINDSRNELKRNNVLLLDNMNDITSTIYTYINTNKHVLIICESGTQTSLTIIACYMIKYGRVDFDFVSHTLHSKHIKLDTNKNLYNYCIKQYYIQLKQQ